MKTRYCLDHHDVQQVGDYGFDRSDPKRPFIVIFLPNDTLPSRLRLYKVQRTDGQEDTAHWKLTGTDECPTLEPSIHWVGHWHGHLVKGELIEC